MDDQKREERYSTLLLATKAWRAREEKHDRKDQKEHPFTSCYNFAQPALVLSEIEESKVVNN